MTIFYFIVGLGLLIFIHELGHFLVAKANGIRVERFSLGFGPRILKLKVGETEYCISLLPLGGYVKMTGQEDFGEEKVEPMEDPRAFNSKGLGARVSVVLAGPVMNLILPFLLMPMVFWMGREEPLFLNQEAKILGVLESSAAAEAGLLEGDVLLSINGQEVPTWREARKHTLARPGESRDLTVLSEGQEKKLKVIAKPFGKEEGLAFWGWEPEFFWDQEPVVAKVSPNSPAEKAGLQRGDIILAIGEESIKYFRDLPKLLEKTEGKTTQVKIQRGGQKISLELRPLYKPEEKRYILGIEKQKDVSLYETRKYALVPGIQEAFKENARLFSLTFRFLGDIFTLKAGLKELGGPIVIAQMSAKEAERGMSNFLFLLCFLSLQLGILNLLPIPVLDGGHLLFMLYEGAVGRPLSSKKRLIAQQVGMFFLLGLMVLVTFNDINRVWGFGKIWESLKGFFG